ncbi:MAG: diguanylate cyclase [Deinococcota bacterium]
MDNLKTINDRQGHKAGDAHLAQFAQVLREEAREGDMVYRVGGDEFVGLRILSRPLD